MNVVLFNVFLIALDIVSKQAATVFLKPHSSIPVMGEFFRLTYGENTGSAFSQFQNHVWPLIVINLICILFLLYTVKNVKNKVERLGYYLILSGAVGNLIDRVARGYVVDFLDFDFFDIHIPSFWFIPEIHMERWPVFNFADSYICIGVFIAILLALRSQKNA
jgi:signal peptidase II